jgi:hypothetical protein
MAVYHCCRKTSLCSAGSSPSMPRFVNIRESFAGAAKTASQKRAAASEKEALLVENDTCVCQRFFRLCGRSPTHQHYPIWLHGMLRILQWRPCWKKISQKLVGFSRRRVSVSKVGRDLEMIFAIAIVAGFGANVDHGRAGYVCLHVEGCVTLWYLSDLCWGCTSQNLLAGS